MTKKEAQLALANLKRYMCGGGAVDRGANKAIDMAIEALSQPEPRWIPVTEATPTEDDDYWCTFGAETGWFVDWCSWYRGRWVVWLDDIPNDVSNVIAWCKPFEPYKGVTE